MKHAMHEDNPKKDNDKMPMKHEADMCGPMMEYMGMDKSAMKDGHKKMGK